MSGLSLSTAMSIANIGGRPYSPSALFVTGANGVVYDPSDPTTLFTTSTGTTQCAVPGSGSQVLVGLMLDKSQGAPGALGSEVVVSPLAGTLGASYSIVGDTIVRNGSTGTAVLNPVGGVIPSTSKTYLVTFTASGVTGDSVAVRVGGGTAYGPFAGNGTFTLRVPGGGTTGAITFLPYAGGAATATYSNISVREIPGNHAIAFNDTTARPELSARVNLLTYSEQFENGVWTKDSCTITANATTAPDGTVTADKVVSAAATAQTGVGQSVTTIATQFTQSWFAKQAEVRFVQLLWNGGASAEYANFDLQTGVVTQTNASVAPTISAAANGFYRITLTSTSASGTVIAYCWAIDSGTTGRAGTYSGNGTNGWFVWGADLRPANIGSAIPSYQRIADQYTYDSNGFPLYLRFDGVDDSMYTPANLNLSGTDKATVFAGVRKLSDAADGMVAELSAVAGLNNGSFLMAFPGNITGVGPNMVLGLSGTAVAYSDARTYTSPITGVLEASFDIAQSSVADEIKQRVNGAIPSSITYLNADCGTGNFGTYPLYIGSRNNASLRFNGHLYSLVVVGSAVPAGSITATEQYVAGKTGVQI